jgi:hypothetical protein
MTRTLAVLLFLGVTSCTMRIGSPAPAAAAAPAPAPIPQARAVPAAANPSRPIATQGRTLGKRVRRPASTTATPAPASQPTATDTSSVAQLCVDEINRYRATLGLRALERAADREGCADKQIRDDATSGKWHGTFGACGEALQNECNSSPTPKDKMIKGCLQGMWNEGPGGGHYEAMKNPSVTKVWCGFYTEPGGGVWSVQDFR